MRVVFGWILLSFALLAEVRFEVASVRQSSTDFRGTGVEPGGKFSGGGVTLRNLVAIAYGLPEFRVGGGPAWVGATRWDVDARANTEERLAGVLIEAPLRALLAERFGLQVKVENRKTPVYFLETVKGRHKMTKTGDAEGRPQIGFGPGFLNSPKVTMPLLATVLARTLGRPVIDRTNLEGGYEVHTSWTPEVGEGGDTFAGVKAHPNVEQRTIFSALQEDLGLRLVAGKSPTPYVTVTSARLPGDN